MKKTIAVMIGAWIIFALVLVTDIGVTKGQIEKEIKERANIDTGWNVESEISKDMAAIIYYDKETKDFDCNIYVNYPGLSFGYLFKLCGNYPEIEDGVGMYESDKIPAAAYVSMNVPKVNRIIIGSGDDAEMIVIDSKKPFAVVVEKDRGRITLYDENDEIVTPKRLT